MNDLLDMSIRDIIGLAQSQISQGQAMISAQQAASQNAYSSNYNSPLLSLLTGLGNLPQSRPARRLTDEQLSRRYRQLTIDLEARRVA